LAAIAGLVKSYLQHHMIECIEPLSALFEDVARCSHLLHAGCETTKDNKDALLRRSCRAPSACSSRSRSRFAPRSPPTS
jgi:hypothetical protein